MVGPTLSREVVVSSISSTGSSSVPCVLRKTFVSHVSKPDTLPLQVFDGVPSPYDKKKRMIIPDALRVTRLRPGRRSVASNPMASLSFLCLDTLPLSSSESPTLTTSHFEASILLHLPDSLCFWRRYTNLGRMCSEVGWKHRETIKTLEEKRKVKSEAYWAKKKEMIQVRSLPPLGVPVRLPFAISIVLRNGSCDAGRTSDLAPTGCRCGERRRRPLRATPRSRRSRPSSTLSRSPSLSSKSKNKDSFLGNLSCVEPFFLLDSLSLQAFLANSTQRKRALSTNDGNETLQVELAVTRHSTPRGDVVILRLQAHKSPASFEENLPWGR
jgi:hypothetical protein